MLNRIRVIFYFITLVAFLTFTVIYYFSDENKKRVNKNRHNLPTKIVKSVKDIPILKNDTENIIEYPNTGSEKEKIKKRYFWDLLK